MITKTLFIPAPFHRLDVFSLIEPAGETETEKLFCERLYLKDRNAEGGRILLREMPSYSIPKHWTDKERADA